MHWNIALRECGEWWGRLAVARVGRQRHWLTTLRVSVEWWGRLVVAGVASGTSGSVSRKKQLDIPLHGGGCN